MSTDQAGTPSPQAAEPLDETLRRLGVEWHLEERPFRSTIPILGPIIARVREAWNSVSTKWYVRAMAQQQEAYNRLLGSLVTGLVRDMEQVRQAAGASVEASNYTKQLVAEHTTRETELFELLEALRQGLAQREMAEAGLREQLEALRQGLAQREMAEAGFREQLEAVRQGLAQREVTEAGLRKRLEAVGQGLTQREMTEAELREQVDAAGYELSRHAMAEAELANLIGSVLRELSDLHMQLGSLREELHMQRRVLGDRGLSIAMLAEQAARLELAHSEVQGTSEAPPDRQAAL